MVDTVGFRAENRVAYLETDSAENENVFQEFPGRFSLPDRMS